MPVFLEHLRLLKTLLAEDQSMLKGEKLATWSIATLGFWGSFRLGEILSSHAKSIDTKIDLLRRDVCIDSRKIGRVTREFLVINLKSPQEAKSNKSGIKVEVNYGQLNKNNAAFRLAESGDCLRHERFNRALKRYFQKYSSYGRLTGHSFRSELSSLLGEAGFSDEEGYSDSECPRGF